MRVSIGKVLAAVLLILCVGLQVLEATGRWDQTFQDAGDEAAIVVLVLCVGGALMAAAAVRPRFHLTAARASAINVRSTRRILIAIGTRLDVSLGPSLPLRI